MAVVSIWLFPLAECALLEMFALRNANLANIAQAVAFIQGTALLDGIKINSDKQYARYVRQGNTAKPEEQSHRPLAFKIFIALKVLTTRNRALTVPCLL